MSARTLPRSRHDASSAGYPLSLFVIGFVRGKVRAVKEEHWRSFENFTLGRDLTAPSYALLQYFDRLLSVIGHWRGKMSGEGNMRAVLTIVISTIALLVSGVSAYFNFYPYEEVIVGVGSKDGQIYFLSQETVPSNPVALVINRGSRPFTVYTNDVLVYQLDYEANKQAVLAALRPLQSELVGENGDYSWLADDEGNFNGTLELSAAWPIQNWDDLYDGLAWNALSWMPVMQEEYLKQSNKPAEVIRAHDSTLLDLSFDPERFGPSIAERKDDSIFMIAIHIEGIDDRGKAHGLLKPAYIGGKGALLNMDSQLAETFIWVGYSFESEFERLYRFGVRDAIRGLWPRAAAEKDD